MRSDPIDMEIDIGAAASHHQEPGIEPYLPLQVEIGFNLSRNVKRIESGLKDFESRLVGRRNPLDVAVPFRPYLCESARQSDAASGKSLDNVFVHVECGNVWRQHFAVQEVFH